jgi:hypothetical protein
MAIIFELWAECKDKEGVQLLADHFTGLKHTLLNGHTIEWIVNLEGVQSGTHGLTVWSRDLSSYGVRTIQDVLETTEAGLHLYKHLKSAPEFRFARVAWDAENIPMIELPEYVDTGTNGSRYLGLACVLDEHLYRQLGSPVSFNKFREGYWWKRYRGESYQPLYSNDQSELNRLCRELFPEYFTY